MTDNNKDRRALAVAFHRQRLCLFGTLANLNTRAYKRFLFSSALKIWRTKIGWMKTGFFWKTVQERL